MSRDLSRVTVLVVDDNQYMRLMVKEVLRAFGFRELREASDGAGAMKEIRIAQPDIVICDINMTPLDGIEFVQMVRNASDSPSPYVPIIMLTGHTELTRVKTARDAGCNEFLAKPFTPRALYDRILAVIDSPRPFVRTNSYFGPDRRRHQIGPPKGSADRRKNPG